MNLPSAVPVERLCEVLQLTTGELLQEDQPGFKMLTCDLHDGTFAVMTVGLGRYLSGEVLTYVSADDVKRMYQVIPEVAHGLADGDIEFDDEFTCVGHNFTVVPQMIRFTDGADNAFVRQVVQSLTMIPPVFYEIVRREDMTARLGQEIPVSVIDHRTPAELKESLGLFDAGIEPLKALIEALVPSTERASKDNPFKTLLEALGPDVLRATDEFEPVFEPIDLEDLEAPFSRPRRPVLPHYGRVETSAELADLRNAFDLSMFKDAVNALRFHFTVAGTPIAQVAAMAYYGAGNDPIEIASKAPEGREWLSTIYKGDGDLSQAALRAWRMKDYDNQDPPLLAIIGVWIAPAFADHALLKHMVRQVEWTIHGLTGDRQVGMTIRAVGLDDTFDCESMSPKTVSWYEQAFVEVLGAVRAERVDHAWGTDDEPRYCDNHARVYLLPKPKGFRRGKF